MSAPTWHPLDIPTENALGDYGLIGDMRTAALVDRWGRIDWLCWPRFDSPPVLRRLIDPAGGGCWQIAPAVPFETSRRYLPDTNVLETTFSCTEGDAVATDFMVAPADERLGSQVIRIVEARSGAVPIRMSMRASHGFSDSMMQLRSHNGAVRIGAGPDAAAVVTANAPIDIIGSEATLDVVAERGQPLVSVMAARQIDAPLAAHAFAAREATAQWWQRWIGSCTLPTVQRAAVVRSALTLKLLQHQPTSALVAAPTTSLPERVGSGRNWDYRYAWLRDSSLMVLALQQLGHHDEAMAYWDWLADVAQRHGDDLSVAYTLDGDRVPKEHELEELPGYRRSRPVRVGNAAARQRQHDVYGHVMAAAAHCYHHMDMDRAAPQPVLTRIADLAAQRWDRPDDSIWEVRNGRSHHTYSRLMCWLTLDRAVDLGRHHALDGDIAGWVRQRDAIRRQVLGRGWNPTVGAFTGTIGGEDLDAATLVAPLIGFLPPDDPRCRATRQALTDRLSDHGLIHRYRQDDGLGGPDGAFLLCTLWLADTHTQDNDLDRGEELLERVLRTGNDLGLLAEEADPRTGEPLGNFPQGLTHLGVVHSALRLEAGASSKG